MGRAIVLATALLSLLFCVGIHSRLLSLLSSRLPTLRIRQRQRVMLGIVGAIGAHLVEIGVFAVAIGALHKLPDEWQVGDILGVGPHPFTDYAYCSALAYTTMGFEGVAPVGHIRLLFGVEALTGLVLIAWTASFTYLQMERNWSEHRGK